MFKPRIVEIYEADFFRETFRQNEKFIFAPGPICLPC